MKTFSTLFSGGEVAGTGIRAAGYRHLWGIEQDDAIANVARANGFHILTADIVDVDPHTLTVPDYLHASPVCTRASQGNQSAELNDDGTKEAPLDIRMGEKVAAFIDVMRPRMFTLENVYGYRNFKAFKIICAALTRNGYMWDYDNLNAADFGVPQTRRRLILRAVRDALLPNLPPPMEWRGWYAAIEDLIPTLPASKFAPWQLARLPEELKTFLCDSAGFPGTDGVTVPVTRNQHEPANTIVANFERRPMRAFLMSGAGNTNFGDAYPGNGVCEHDEPAQSVTALDGGGTAHRAFVVAGMPNNNGASVIVRHGDSPMMTVTAQQNQRQSLRAFLINGSNSGRELTIAEANAPSFVVTSQRVEKDGRRAWLSQGRVVSMTPRALARFQSIPDSYELPADTRLAARVIGNGWPSLMAQRIAELFDA